MKRIAAGFQGTLFIALAALLAAGCTTSSASIPSGGTGIESSISSPTEMSVGDVMSLELSSQQTSLALDDIDADAEFVLVTGTSDVANGSSFDVTASEGTDATPLTASKVAALADETVDPSIWLRIAERELSRTVHTSPVTSSKAITLGKTIALGNQAQFKVLANLSNPCGDVNVVDGTAAFVGHILAFFVEDGITVDEDLRTLFAQLDDQASRVVSMIGNASDVNVDGHVVVNINTHMPTSWTGSPLGGYSYGNDITPYQGCEQTSNHQEIIHINYGTYATGLLATTVVHELQHQINYSRRVALQGAPAEHIWLDEALSHLIEELTGNGELNSVWVNAFRSNPASSLVVEESMTSAQRGAAFLFLKYLYGRAADKDLFLHTLVNSGLVGVENMVRAFARATGDQKAFSELMAQWTAAVALSGRTDDIVPQFSITSKSETNIGAISLAYLSDSQSIVLEPSSAQYFHVAGGTAVSVSSSSPRSFSLLIRIK